MAKAKQIAEKAAAAGGLISALKNAGNEDLDAMDREIESLNGQIESLRQDQSALRYARRVVGIKINGIPPRKSKVRSGQRDARRDQIYEYLTATGPASYSEIANATKIPEGSMYALLKHEWFVGEDGLWCIAKKKH